MKVPRLWLWKPGLAWGSGRGVSLAVLGRGAIARVERGRGLGGRGPWVGFRGGLSVWC